MMRAILLILAIALGAPSAPGATADETARAVGGTAVVELGTHAPDGYEPLEDEPVLLAYTPAKFDPLPGRCYRANLSRDGVYPGPGPAAGQLRWKIDTGKEVVGSPVVVDGVLYLGTHLGLTARDAGSGAERWAFPVPGGVHSTPCVAGDKVLFGGQDGGLYCLAATDGKLLWRAKGSGAITASPGVAYGIAFIDRGIGFDLATGQMVWSTPKSKSLRGPSDGRLASMALLPDAMILPGFTGNALAYKNGKFLFGGESSWEGENSVACSGGKLFAVESGAGGNVKTLTLTCKNLADGNVAWATPLLPDETSKTRYMAFCSPGAWRDLVVVGSDAGEMYGFDARKGERLWVFKTGGALRSPPSFADADGTVYFGSDDGKFYALDARTGAKRWEFAAGAAIQTSPCIAGGTVYFAADDGFLYALR